MAINRAQVKKQLQEGLNTVFGLEYKRYPEQWRDIFEVGNETRKAYVEDVLMTGFGGAQTKGEGSSVAYDSAQEGWVSRYVFETIALAFAITEEAEEDNLYMDMGSKLSKAMARSFQYTKNVKGANILNNGFDTNYTGGDGKPLFATDHPLVGGGTYSNKLSTAADLSETSIEDLLILQSKLVDDRGLPIQSQSKKLIVPVELQFVAERIMKSANRVGTADNDINAVKNLGLIAGGYSVNNFLTDNDAFFLTTDVNDGLKFIQRKAVSGGVESDFDTGNMRFKKRERYVFGWSDARCAVASAGA
jgi:hypothetical protein